MICNSYTVLTVADTLIKARANVHVIIKNEGTMVLGNKNNIVK